jgi:hypothetical protein
MIDKSFAKVGGVCAILVGISYIVVGISFLLVPGDQQMLSEPAKFLPSFDDKPAALSIEFVALIVGAVFAFAAIPAISELVRAGNEGWVRWMSGLAYLGFGVTALNCFRLLTLLPKQADTYVGGSLFIKNTVAQDFNNLSLDPHVWLIFGGVGLWILIVNVLAFLQSTFPKLLALIGIAAAILYGLVVAGYVFDSSTLVTIAAVLGGIILGPIWYIWSGVRLFQTRQPVEQAG